MASSTDMLSMLVSIWFCILEEMVGYNLYHTNGYSRSVCAPIGNGTSDGDL